MKTRRRKIIHVWEHMDVAFSCDIVGDLLDGFTVDPNLFPGRAQYFPRVFWITLGCMVLSLLVPGAYSIAAAALGFATIWNHLHVCAARERDLAQWPTAVKYRVPSWTPQLLRHAEELADRLQAYQSPMRAAQHFHAQLKRRRQENAGVNNLIFFIGVGACVVCLVVKLWILFALSAKGNAQLLATFFVPTLNFAAAFLLADAWFEAESKFARIAGECWLFEAAIGVLQIRDDLAPAA